MNTLPEIYAEMKREILITVHSINTSTITSENDTNAKILEQLSSGLNQAKIKEGLTQVLSKKDYTLEDISEVSHSIVSAPLSYSAKINFIQDLKKDQVLKTSLLTKPGVYDLSEFVHDNKVYQDFFNMFKSFKVGSQCKGPYEHAIDMFSSKASIAPGNKGDIIVDGKRVELKASRTVKSNCGQLGDSSFAPSRSQVESILFSHEKLKNSIDLVQKENNRKSLNLENFVNCLNMSGVTDAQRKEVVYELFESIFGHYSENVSKAVYESRSHYNTNIFEKFVVANYDWYKEGMVGKSDGWDYLVAIAPYRNKIIVTASAQDFLSSPFGRTQPAILTSGKPREMYTRVDVNMS